jgi:hypothetical protein
MLAALAVVGAVDLFVLGWAVWLGRCHEIVSAEG